MAEETTPKLLTDHERDVLDARYHAGLLLKQGYYIGFEETGVPGCGPAAGCSRVGREGVPQHRGMGRRRP
jgi:hypothetical protein